MSPLKLLFSIFLSLLVNYSFCQPYWQNITFAAGNAGYISVPKPYGTSFGDLLIVSIAYEKGEEAILSVPKDWSLILRTDQENKIGLSIYSKIANSFEPIDYPISSLNSRYSISMIRISGHGGMPIIRNGSSSPIKSIRAIAPSITTNVDSCLILTYYTNSSIYPYLPAGGTKKVYDFPNSAWGMPSNTLLEYVQYSAGPTGDKISISDYPEIWVAQQIAIAPYDKLRKNSGINIISNTIPKWSILTNPILNKQLHVQSNTNGFISIYDFSGKVILNKIIAVGLNKISLSNIPKGIYIVYYNNESKKLIIE